MTPFSTPLKTSQSRRISPPQRSPASRTLNIRAQHAHLHETDPPDMLPSAHQQVRRRQGSKHDKSGCLTCRYRRKKCSDNQFPICGTCARLNLECIRQPTKRVVPDDWAVEKCASKGAAPQRLPPSSPLPPTPPAAGLSFSGGAGHVTRCPRRRHAIRYYISVLSTYLTVSQEYNSFLTAFLPMAMESATLLDALLALASGHISLTDEAYKVTALETKATAIRNLSLAISNPSEPFACHETTAAACLLFVIYDVGVGDCGAWYTHLKGTQQIISSTSTSLGGKPAHGPDAFKNSIEGQWILRNFAYHDIIGSVTMRRRPLLDSDYLDGITGVVDSCTGIAAGLLRIVAQICCLDEETEPRRDLTFDQVSIRQQIFRSTYPQLEQELVNWRCDSNAKPELAALAYTYRNAALVVLYRLMRNRVGTGHSAFLEEQDRQVDGIQTKLQAQVVDTLQHATEIPIGTPTESALLFPLFMVGGEALEKQHIDMVRTRLRLMAKKRQFRNLSQARNVLEDLWDLRETHQERNADWSYILDSSGEDLLLT